MEAPQAQMTMERIILSDQYGIRWLGGISTFKYLDLVTIEDNGAGIFNWGNQVYFLAGHVRKLDEFVDGLLAFSAAHLRPQADCDLSDIETYCKLLMNKIQAIFELGEAAH